MEIQMAPERIIRTLTLEPGWRNAYLGLCPSEVAEEELE